MPRRRDPAAERVVHRTARVAVRVTPGQRRRCFGLLRSAGDVWACVVEVNAWRRRRWDTPLAGYQQLCRELAASGPGTFAELNSVGARSVLRRFSDAWFAAAKRRKDGDLSARFPRRRRGLVPVRWYHGTFTLDGRRLRIPTARGTAPLWVRLAREVPYPAEQIRSITLLCEGGRLFLDVTAEVPVTVYPAGEQPDPGRVAGVDLGITHPYAVAGPDGEGLLVSGRAIRAEHRMHLTDTKARRRAVSRRAPKPGQKGSRRWRQYRRRARLVEGRHRRRVRQAQHEAARGVVSWAVRQRVGVLHVGDPRGVLDLSAGRRHNLRLRQWQIGRLLQVLTDKATLAGITVRLVDERGTSSTCPACARRVPKPRGRTLSCPHCAFSGHRDLVAAASIATRTPGGGPTTPTAVVLPQVVTHVELAGTSLVPDGPDVTRGAQHGWREDQLARGGPPHHPVGSRSPTRRGSNTHRIPGER
ncbi:transposase [Micromonospora sp. CPCC 206171]|uniref:RNA-guided endonuclease InsQ/TnpB family protein n=1 Tax=Micromonospora sp. CPCC 206171 TaxID=3122405 RepID=UPI002FEFDD33